MDKNLDNIKIAYIGGGSRNWAWKFMSDLSREDEICGSIMLYDIDKKAAEVNAFIGNALSERPETAGKWKYIVCSSLKEALQNTDFVVISILPGTFEHMRSDVHEPEKYGIYQSVGDTAGPGGFFRAMRTIPMFVEIAEAVKNYSPNAWVINYTNPMSVCVRTLYKVFPEIKAIGCCHEVFGAQYLLVRALKDICNIENVKRSEIITTIQGINHFTWFTKASYKNIDLFNIFEEFSRKYYYSGFIDEENKNWETDTFKFCERLKFDLFNKFHAIASAGDRHLAEFLPFDYLTSPEQVREWKYGLTTVDWRIKDRDEKLNRSMQYASLEKDFEVLDSDEEGVLIIKSLLGLHRLITNVNLPNKGQINGFPNDIIVETNAVISRDDISSILTGSLDDKLYDIIYPHAAIQEKTVDAGLLGDKEKCRDVFFEIINGYSLNSCDAEKLFNDMYKNSLI